MKIKWADLGQVAEVSLAFGVGIVLVFTLGVLGLVRAREGVAGSGRAVGLTAAAVAFGLCAAAVAYGLYLLIPQFH